MTDLTPQVLQAAAYAVRDEVTNPKNPYRFDVYQMPLLRWLETRKKARSFNNGKLVTKLARDGGLTLEHPTRGSTLSFGEVWPDDELEFTPSYDHLGQQIVHQDLMNMGFTVVPNQPRSEGSFARKLPQAQALMLVDYLKLKMETMLKDWDEQQDLQWWRDGTQATGAPDGIDALLPLDNTSGSYGGKSRADQIVRHAVKTGSTVIASGTLERDLNQLYREITMYTSPIAGSKVDMIRAGDDWIDGYVAYCKANGLEYKRELGDVSRVDIAMPDSKIHWNGIPIVNVPTFRKLDEIGAYSGTPWAKRAYFMQSATWELAYQAGFDKVMSFPPDPADRRLSYISLDGRYSLICHFPRGNGISTIA